MDRYAQQATAQAWELVEALTESEIQSLREYFSAAEWADWWQWTAANSRDIDAFLVATPSARRRKRRWAQCFPLLTFAAYERCCQAAALMAAMSRLDLTPGGQYRETTARAAQAWGLAEQLASDFPEWPWNEDDEDSPLPDR